MDQHDQKNSNRLLRLLHAVSTAWFVICAGVLVVVGLRQAGIHWWVIFSLSGYSVIVMMLLISLYLFAIFRGVTRSQKKEIEHPLTSSIYYAVFYDISPFLGTLAGFLGAVDRSKLFNSTLLALTGTLSVTFLVWIIIDPVIGLVEMLLPASRAHRRQRLEEARMSRQAEQLRNEQILREIEQKERQEHIRLQQALAPYAKQMVELIVGYRTMGSEAETKAVDIGLVAWQMGGLNCMKQLQSMSLQEYRQQSYPDEAVIDYIPIWWDGIGNWRSPSLPENIRKIA